MSTSILSMNIHDRFCLGLTGWISFQPKGLSRVFSNTTVQNHRFFGAQLYSPTLTSIYDHWKTKGLTRQNFVDKVMSMLCNMLSRLGIAFHPRNKRLFLSCLQLPSGVILEPRKIKYLTVSTVGLNKEEKWYGPNRNRRY